MLDLSRDMLYYTDATSCRSMHFSSINWAKFIPTGGNISSGINGIREDDLPAEIYKISPGNQI